MVDAVSAAFQTLTVGPVIVYVLIGLHCSDAVTEPSVKAHVGGPLCHTR